MSAGSARFLGALSLSLLFGACAYSPTRGPTERRFEPGRSDLDEVLVLLPPIEPLPPKAWLASPRKDSADPNATNTIKAAWTRLLCESARRGAYSPAQIACGDSLLLTPYQVRDTLLPLRSESENPTLRRFILPILPLPGGREPPGNFLLLPQRVEVMTIPDPGSERRVVSLEYVVMDRRDGRIVAYGWANGAANVPTRPPERIRHDPRTGAIVGMEPVFAGKLGMQPRHLEKISERLVDDMLHATPFQRKK